MVQVNESGQRYTWRAELHAKAGNGIQHPSRDHGDDAGRHFEMSDFTIASLLTVFAAHAAAMKGMPPVADDHLFPDMGRMTTRCHWDERTHCSLVRVVAANVGRCWRR